MSFLENPTVKRVLMIVVALAVVAAVAYVIYHFTAGPGAHHGSAATTTSHMDAGTTQHEVVPEFTGIDTHILGGTVGHQPGMSSEGFTGCPAQQREDFDTQSPISREGFAGCSARQMVQEGFDDPSPAENGQESVAKPLGGDNTLGMNQMPSECYPKDVLSSVDLLPSDANSHYAMVNPNGQGALSDQNFLTSGYHIGINTIGQTLRNANRQLRSDPPCPQVAVSPWNNTTIEYDGNRRPLEIGGAP